MPTIRHLQVNRFTRQYRLTRTDDFSSVFDFRRRIKGRYIDLYYRPSEHGYTRLGLIVGKKVVKSAVKRNYMRRTLRELFRSHEVKYDLSYDLIIRAKRFYSARDYQWLVQDFEKLMTRLNESNTSVSS